jgi:cell division protein FtsB
MGIGRAIKRRLKAIAAPCVFLLLTVYFIWSAIHGEHGLEAYAARQLDLRAAQDDQARVVAELAVWQRRVAALRNNHLDTDALDERARAILNLADPNDVVVPLKRSERTF